MTIKKWGTPKGASFWHRQVNGVFEEMRLDPGHSLPEGDWVKGHIPKTEEEKARISAKNTGRVMSPEWRAKMSAASKGKPKSEAHKAAMKAAVAEYHRKRKAGEL